MKRITGFSDEIEYLNRLGFAGAGSIAARQHNLCEVIDSLQAAAAGSYPYRVQFYRNPDAPRFPFLGEFTVIGAAGRVERVKPGRR